MALVRVLVARGDRRPQAVQDLGLKLAKVGGKQGRGLSLYSTGKVCG
jgi:hypothetical protein